MSNLPSTMAAMPHLTPAAGAFAQSSVDAKVINEGIGASFPILTFRGKVWRIKYRGEEHPLVLPPTVPGGPPAGPMPTIPVIIVHASPAVAKIFYEGQYAEGDNEAPDCFSVNGNNPDPASPKKQSELCATCPRNMWGSKTLPSGKPGKACQDSKRLVVVPAGDPMNEMFGGPMLLRIPPASLQDMGAFNSNLQQFGHKFFTVETTLGFDMTTAYPKLTFTATRSLGEGEASIVVQLQNDPRTKRILSDAVDQVRAEVPAALAGPGAAPLQIAAPVVAAPIVPTPMTPPARDPSYQYTPDGQQRWKAPMPAWEPVPATAPAVMAPPPTPAPAPMPAPMVHTAAPVVMTPAPIPAPLYVAPEPDLAIPAFLQRGAPVAPASPPQVTAPTAPAAPAAPAPQAQPFRILTPEEMTQLTPDQMAAYMAQWQTHMAASQPVAVVKKRGTRTATVAPPSPAPTAPPLPTPLAMAPPPTAPAMAPPLPNTPPDPALASLDDKLGALLG